jgi:hypothetical protein
MALTSSNYRAPSRHDTDDNKLGWLQECIQAGESFIHSQRGYTDVEKARMIIAGTPPETLPKHRSRIRINRPKRQVREVVGTISNLRPVWEYKTDNKERYTGASEITRMARAWWYNTFADQGIKETMQYSGVDGMGYAGLSWDADYWTPGRGDIRFHSYGVDDVLPVQIGPDHDIQRAYVVVIRRKVPIFHAHALFPAMAHLITPDDGKSAALSAGMGTIQKFLSPALNILGVGGSGGRDDSSLSEHWPMVTIYHAYVLDNSTNSTGQLVRMGEGNWGYNVPYPNMPLPDGYNADGMPRVRNALPADCLLYPYRRLMIFTGTTILKDNSSPLFSGMVPVVPFYMDKWPWDYLPYSLVRDIAPIAASNDSLHRAIDDAANVRLRPPTVYDDQTIAKSVMMKLDLRKPGESIGMDLSRDLGIRPILDPHHYDVPPWITQHIADQEARSDYLVGVQDFAALAKARQLPSGDTMETLMQATGPLLADITRSVEKSMRGLGELWKGLAMQHYTTARRVQILGKDHAPAEEFDYQPTNMIPSHMPDERPDEGPSKKSLIERARAHIHSFYLYIQPNSLHEINQMSRKLMVIQLWRSGFPIDPWSVAEANEIENYGPPPEGTRTKFERWLAWQRMKTEQAIEAAQTLQAAQGGAAPPAAGAVGNASGEPGQAGPGRPPSGQEAPKLTTKDGGTRPTITES